MSKEEKGYVFAFLTNDSKLFHARAEATGKARSPSANVWCSGMKRSTLGVRRSKVKITRGQNRSQKPISRTI